MIRLSPKQRIVLNNCLAWCDDGYNPTPAAIRAFFAWNDKGKALAPEGVELYWGWMAHYSNPYGWIAMWESGEQANPPILPPAAWVYDAYFAPSPSTWQGWFNILVDYFKRPNWIRVRPAYETAYRMSAYHHGRISVDELMRRIST